MSESSDASLILALEHLAVLFEDPELFDVAITRLSEPDLSRALTIPAVARRVLASVLLGNEAGEPPHPMAENLSVALQSAGEQVTGPTREWADAMSCIDILKSGVADMFEYVATVEEKFPAEGPTRDALLALSKCPSEAAMDKEMQRLERWLWTSVLFAGCETSTLSRIAQSGVIDGEGIRIQ